MNLTTSQRLNGFISSNGHRNQIGGEELEVPFPAGPQGRVGGLCGKDDICDVGVCSMGPSGCVWGEQGVIGGQCKTDGTCYTGICASLPSDNKALAGPTGCVSTEILESMTPQPQFFEKNPDYLSRFGNQMLRTDLSCDQDKDCPYNMKCTPEEKCSWLGGICNFMSDSKLSNKLYETSSDSFKEAFPWIGKSCKLNDPQTCPSTTGVTGKCYDVMEKSDNDLETNNRCFPPIEQNGFCRLADPKCEAGMICAKDPMAYSYCNENDQQCKTMQQYNAFGVCKEGPPEPELAPVEPASTQTKQSITQVDEEEEFPVWAIVLIAVVGVIFLIGVAYLITSTHRTMPLTVPTHRTGTAGATRPRGVGSTNATGASSISTTGSETSIRPGIGSQYK